MNKIDINSPYEEIEFISRILWTDSSIWLAVILSVAIISGLLIYLYYTRIKGPPKLS